MAQWHKPRAGQPEGKVFWYEEPDYEDEYRALFTSDVLFVFYLEADPRRVPTRPWEVLKSRLARLDELVLRRQGIRASINEQGWLWVDEEELERFRSILAKAYGNRVKIVDLVAGYIYLVGIDN